MSGIGLKTYDAGGNLMFDSQQYYYFCNAEFQIIPTYRTYPISTTNYFAIPQAFIRTFPAPIPLTANPFAIIAQGPALSNLANVLAAVNGARHLCYWDFIKSADNLKYTGMTIYAEAENPAYYNPNYWIVQVWALGIYDA